MVTGRTIHFRLRRAVNLRVRYGRTTAATVDVSSGSMAASASLRDRGARHLIAGSATASLREGNPDRPVALADEGFCFRSYLGTAYAQYYRPSRPGYKGRRACEAPDTCRSGTAERAVVQSGLHRSLYSYQTRTALALAVQYPHIAVTYLRWPAPAHHATGCSARSAPRMPAGEGVAKPPGHRQQPARRTARSCGRPNAASPTASSTGAAVGSRQRHLFFGLVADVSWTRRRTRAVPAQRRDGSVEDARSALTQDLPQGFSKTARGAKPLAATCRGWSTPPTPTRRSRVAARRVPADARGSTSILLQRRAAAARRRLEFRRKRIFAAVEGARAVQSGILCRNPRYDRMTFVDGIRPRLPITVFLARGRRPIRIRPAMLFGHRRQLRSRSRQRRQPADAVRRAPANTAPTCRARAGSATQ